ncbi:serine/threonine-protein kinase [Nocardia sp. CA-129566]|uniref:serine/threonine-protein kinase n=1 Tax=Nocardia sp. CA-129566 TaxID=3239976 RepID=UPI003D989CDF
MDDISFGRYRLQELIGEGGMGQVWRAYDTDTDRIVAVKLLPERCAADPGFRERFRREAHATARLREPHVIPIHGYGEISGRLYLDMRLIDGIDAKTLLARDGAMPPATAVAVISQAASALDAAHAEGLVHRDIKPSNLIVTDSGFVYLIDFGIARAIDDPGLTSSGATIGTLAYMAPERFATGIADARSDVYSLTCVLCECLTGLRPYPGNSFEQQIAAHLTADPPTLSQRRPDLPGGFDDVIARGMAKDPDHRYPTAGALAAAARDALPGTTAPIARSPSSAGLTVPNPRFADRDRLGAPPPIPSTRPDTPEPPAALNSDQAPTTAASQFDSLQLAQSEAEPILRDHPAPPRRKRPVSFIGSALAAVLIVGAAVLGMWGLNHTSAAHTGAAHTSQPSKSMPAFDGKYEITRTTRTINGKPVQNPPRYNKTWSVRSYCPSQGERCVASITIQDPSAPDKAPGQAIADYRDGGWLMTRERPPAPVCTSNVNNAPVDATVWERVVIQFADQSWTGTATSYTAGACTMIQEEAMTIRRVGEIDPNVAVVAPETIPARADPPPPARISGVYDVTITYISVPNLPETPAPETARLRYDIICLRSADRCAAAPHLDPSNRLIPTLVLEDGAWRSVYTVPFACYLASNDPYTDATLHWDLFPSDPGSDPIKSLTGTWALDKNDPCRSSSRATVDMQRVGD